MLPRSLQTITVLTVLGVMAVTAGRARAELIALQIQRREAFAGGASFGKTGPYEKIVGVARFAVDPTQVRFIGVPWKSMRPPQQTMAGSDALSIPWK